MQWCLQSYFLESFQRSNGLQDPSSLRLRHAVLEPNPVILLLFLAVILWKKNSRLCTLETEITTHSLPNVDIFATVVPNAWHKDLETFPRAPGTQFLGTCCSGACYSGTGLGRYLIIERLNSQDQCYHLEPPETTRSSRHSVITVCGSNECTTETTSDTSDLIMMTTAGVKRLLLTSTLNPKHVQTLKPKPPPIWVVVKIMVPFWLGEIL